MKHKRNLYFSNRKEYYRRKRISASLKKYYSNKRILEESIKEEKHFYRNSIAYYNYKYDKTIRAEIVTTEKLNNERIQKRLSAYINKWIDRRKGLKKIYESSEVQGIESEEIGENDISPYEINNIYVSVG